MASNPSSDTDKPGKKRESDRLPFEPTSGRKKAAKKEKVVAASTPTPSTPSTKASASSKASTSSDREAIKGSETRKKSPAKQQRRPKYSREESAIPEAVSQRMIKRIALLSGIPTALGISSFIVSYFIVINEVIKLPTVAVLLVSLGFFGLGVVGISYGALSTSWEVEDEGSFLGWNEFTTNLGRMKQAWQESRNQAKS